ncbi:MAG: ABC transporter permease [Anaerolineales bacterium]|nr:ABC transporter permease [Anaerolineales bacterium]
MSNTLKVIRHEIVTTLSKPSFWIMTFIFPLVVIGLSLGSQLFAQETVEAAEDSQPGQGGNILAIVDEFGFMEEIPADIPPGLVALYTNRADANLALAGGEISQYYIIPEDFLETGEVNVIVKEFSLFESSGTNHLLNFLLRVNLLGDTELAQIIHNPSPETDYHRMNPTPPEVTAVDGGNNFLLPYAVMLILYMLIVVPGAMMLSSVTKEKENRTMEVLLSSLRPRELMMGKLLGIGMIALFQVICWGGGILLARQSARESLQAILGSLDPTLMGWGFVFLLLGFFLYASMQGALGAMVPNVKEGSQFTFIILMPMMIPLMLITSFMENPNGGLATFLSLFPLTSPTSMMTRMVVAAVPLWQTLTSLAILTGTTFLIVLLASRFFRADTLLSGSKPTRAELAKLFSRK